MRKAAERQVEESQEMVRASQLQLERQQRPALVLDNEPERAFLMVSNIGDGPALDVTFSLTEPQRSLDFSVAPIEGSKISYLMARQSKETTFDVGSLAHVGGFFSVLCKYHSLSGTEYYSMVDFDQHGPTCTRFAPKRNTNSRRGKFDK